MRILLAIDDSSCSEAAISTLLNRTKIPDTEVLVLHVIDPCQLTPIAFSFIEGPEAVRQCNELRLKWHAEANRLVTQTAERLEIAGIKASTLVREGEPKSVILDQASQWQADLIVLGSHGRRGINRFLLGSVSDTVAQHSPCSTMIVRPEAQEQQNSFQPTEAENIHTPQH